MNQIQYVQQYDEGQGLGMLNQPGHPQIAPQVSIDDDQVYEVLSKLDKEEEDLKQMMQKVYEHIYDCLRDQFPEDFLDMRQIGSAAINTIDVDSDLDIVLVLQQGSFDRQDAFAIIESLMETNDSV